MRILQINSARGWGGGETHTADLRAGLEARGHRVLLAGRAGSALAPDITCGFRNAWDLPTALQLRRRLRREDCDIVHVHLARDYPLAAAALLGLPRIRLVATRHLLYPLRRHRLLRRVDGWIAPTRQIEQTLVPLRPRHSVVIPHGLALETWIFREPQWQTPLRLGILGQIAPHKGHDDALTALRALGPGYRLAIGGMGEAGYIRGLQAAARGLNVEFRGRVAAREFLAETDILLVPSWEEPFGMVVLEAMAAGVPVVATNRGGPAEILTAGVHGLLVPPRQPEALAAAIRDLAGQPALARRMAGQARARVSAGYTLEAMAGQVEQFYRRLLGEPA